MDLQSACWSHSLRPQLQNDGTYFVEPNDYTPGMDQWLKQYFATHIFPVLTPLAFDPGHPFPYISNLSMNLAVRVKHGGRTKFARVKVRACCPASSRSRRIWRQAGQLVRLSRRRHPPEYPGAVPGHPRRGAHLFRIIRDTDMVIQEDEADDLLETVDRGLKQLRYGARCRYCRSKRTCRGASSTSWSRISRSAKTSSCGRRSGWGLPTGAR